MNRQLASMMRQSLYGLVLACLFCLPLKAFSQASGDRSLPVVRLGDNNTDNNMRMKVTKEQVFTNPELVCKLKGCEVTSFTISFVPKGAGISGPYKTMGARIKDAQLQFLRSSPNPEIKIFFEDIHINKDGKDVVTKPLVVICTP